MSDERSQSQLSEHAEADAAFELWRRRRRPDDEVPVSIAVDAVIGRSDSVAVFIGSVSVYNNGVEFTTEARAASPLAGDARRTLLADGILGHAASDEANLHLGVEFSDGRRCLGSQFGGGAPSAGDEPMLLPGGGGGSERDARATWFLSPLPPPGTVTIYCAWPAAGIPEAATALRDLHQFATGVRELWPRMPFSERLPAPGAVAIRTDGWFATPTTH